MFDLSPHCSNAFAALLWRLVKRLASALVALVFVISGLVGWIAPAQAQAGLAPSQPLTAINAINQLAVPSASPNTPYANPCNNGGSLAGCAGATVNLTFGAGNNRTVNAPTTQNGLTLRRITGLNESVVLRRGNFAVSGSTTRDILFYETATITDTNAFTTAPPPTDISLAPDQAVDIAATLLSPVVNRGIDNVFNNSSGAPAEDTRSNIERIDYLLRDGIVVPPEFQAQEGFLVLERGGNDVFGIAAITGLDAAGNPTSYGPLRSVAEADWGTATDVQMFTIVFRRETAGAQLQPSHLVRTGGAFTAQNVRGIFFPINSLLTAPQSNAPIFGYSLFAADVAAGATLTNPDTFPRNTSGANNGGLDLVAGGFGLFRAPRPGNLFLHKRISRLTAAGNAVTFTGTENPGNNTGFPSLVAAGLGQGTVTVTNPQLQPSDDTEYVLYFNNTGDQAVTNVQICDQIPPGTSFRPDTFGAGSGVQAIPPTNAQTPPVAYPTVNYTNAADGDAATFLPPGNPLPAICGVDRGNGAVVVNVGTVGANQVGLVRFRASVNPTAP
jgi:uncharacterized repeat protein (TIGR01451 family)